MASPRVLIIGCGVAGPVIALLLKQKGYYPIIFERAETLDDIGASVMIFPNGLKVLDRVGDVSRRLLENGPNVEWLLDYRAEGPELGGSDVPGEWATRYGKPAVGVKRTLIASWLRDLVKENDIELREGWSLERIEDTKDDVTAYFGGGRSETGTFLVGCDGLRATSRKLLLARQGISDGLPTFTGIIQTSGISPTPPSFRSRSGTRNWYGAGMHFVCYQITHEHTSWALTQPEDSGEEASWCLFGSDERQAILGRLVERLRSEGWDKDVVELVASSHRLIKYGIFDRPALEPEQWYSSRCVMVGDAVHPMSVHAGQGANQACEDCYYLVNLLPSFDPSGLSNSQLHVAFSTYAKTQQPHVSQVAIGARKIGAMRVVPAAGRDERDEAVRRLMSDREGLHAKYDFLFSKPF
ncbi:FAD/NAD(P)-binding domain-containing protein [Apiospora arundinis]